MNDTASFDEMGIRGTSGGNLVYSNAHRFEWLGDGIMDKPISDFPHYPDAFGISPSWDGRTRKIPLILFIVAVESLCVVYSRVIPEPEEYALVFGLFVLAFVIVRRRWEVTSIMRISR